MQATVTKVECFGQCGAELECRCRGATTRHRIGQQHRACLVHGKYGSLCMSCLGELVVGTLP